LKAKTELGGRKKGRGARALPSGGKKRNWDGRVKEKKRKCSLRKAPSKLGGKRAKKH